MAEKRRLWSIHWEMLGLTVVLFVLAAVLVDFRPVVDENFFFSTSDPQFRQTKKIEKQMRKRRGKFKVRNHNEAAKGKRTRQEKAA